MVQAHLWGVVWYGKDVHWHEELGLAQAMWVISQNMGSFIVESDLKGNSCLNVKMQKSLIIWKAV